jgi:hypothetical protein
MWVDTEGGNNAVYRTAYISRRFTHTLSPCSSPTPCLPVVPIVSEGHLGSDQEDSGPQHKDSAVVQDACEKTT